MKSLVAVLAVCAHGIVYEQITWPTPATEARASTDGVISGDGNWVVFESDADFQETGLATYADGVGNIWKKQVGGDVYIQVSNKSKPSDRDTYRPKLSHNGSVVCFESNNGIEKVSNINVLVGDSQIQVTKSTESSLDAKYCSISADGGVVAFQSDISLLVDGVEVGKSKDQIYITNDYGASFTMLTPSNVSQTSSSGYPALSADAAYLAFRSKMEWPLGSGEPESEDAWLVRIADGELAKISNVGPKCDTDAIYATLVQLHGQEALDNESVSSVSSSSCPYAAVEGMIPATSTIGVGAMQPKISGDGRFVTYTTNFNVADTFGTHQKNNPVAQTELFLYDRMLGMTWKLLDAGQYASGLNLDGSSKSVEDFCCPDASSSKKRGSCSKSNELKGWCCWQKPCGFVALNSDISSDGNSIVFVSDIDLLGTNTSKNKDLEIFHYHRPTSSLLRITETNDADLDDVYPSINAAGNRVVWTSDADHVGTKDYTGANQMFLAELTFGSRNSGADNYAATPDVEVASHWSTVVAAEITDQQPKETLTLTFEGNITTLWDRLPWKSDAAKDQFCEHFVQDVHEDLAFALAHPHQLILITSPATNYAGTRGRYDSSSCGDWGEGVPISITVDFLPQSSFSSISGLKTPAEVKDELLKQHGDDSSFLWKGYLTKILSASVTPTSESVQMRELPETLSQTSAGSCYSMATHQISCNVEEQACGEYYYPPGFVGGSGCCHCQASCDFSAESTVYGTCTYYDDADDDAADDADDDAADDADDDADDDDDDDAADAADDADDDDSDVSLSFLGSFPRSLLLLALAWLTFL